MRTGAVCFECGAPALYAHHVIPRSLGGTKTVPLCHTCHELVHDRAFDISALTKDALQSKRVNGEKLGGHAPYGFTVAADGKTLIPAVEEHALLVEIQTLRQQGLSQRAVVAELTRKGFTTRKGTALSLMQVQRIMQQAQIA